MEKKEPESGESETAAGRRSGRTRLSRDKQFYSPFLEQLVQREAQIAVRHFAHQIRAHLLHAENSAPQVVSITRMLNGNDRMSDRVFRALHAVAGFDGRIPSDIWDCATTEEFNDRRGADAQTLIAQIRRLSSGPGKEPCSLRRVGPAMAKAGDPTGIAMLAPGSHKLELALRGIETAWVVFLEYGHAENQWWSLVDTSALTYGGDPMPCDAIINRRYQKELVIKISPDIGRYEVFALMSRQQFPIELFNYIQANNQAMSTSTINDRRLSEFLGSIGPEIRRSIYAVSFAYQV